MVDLPCGERLVPAGGKMLGHAENMGEPGWSSNIFLINSDLDPPPPLWWLWARGHHGHERHRGRLQFWVYYRDVAPSLALWGPPKPPLGNPGPGTPISRPKHLGFGGRPDKKKFVTVTPGFFCVFGLRSVPTFKNIKNFWKPSFIEVRVAPSVFWVGWFFSPLSKEKKVYIIYDK